MCGRYAMDKTVDELIVAVHAAGGEVPTWRPSYSIAPTDVAPVVRDYRDPNGHGSIREVIGATWDIPKPDGWRMNRPIINARFEKLTDSFWVGPFSSARVLIPIAGFFEWTGPAGAKTPHFIHGDTLLTAAGVAKSVQTSDGWQTSFAIVTREARDAAGEVHDRMPAFLTEDHWDQWLNPESLTVPKNAGESRARREDMLAMLESVSTAVASTLRTHIVDRRVNSVRAVDRSDPAVIAPVT